MKSGIRAIETRFDNIMFRSRIEARWAMVFKQLGIRYIYEQERYEMFYNGVKFVYMPDFNLIDLNCFVEVKGKQPNGRERNVAWVLSKYTDCLVHIVFGQIPYPFIDDWYRYDFDTFTYDATFMRFGQHIPTKYALNQCSKCSRIEFVPNGDRALISCGCERINTNLPTRKIASAFMRARMERFDRKR